MNDTVWSVVCLHQVAPRIMKNVWDTTIKTYHIDSLMLNIHPNDGENQIICVLK